jgi:hypothetical protein
MRPQLLPRWCSVTVRYPIGLLKRNAMRRWPAGRRIGRSRRSLGCMGMMQMRSMPPRTQVAYRPRRLAQAASRAPAQPRCRLLVDGPNTLKVENDR